MNNDFTEFAATPENKYYDIFTQRQYPIYDREGDVRTPFMRDYTRVLHSLAYRRLKHKTQVFCNIDNDHICTRMEHVSHVESVSFSIASRLNLNCSLTRAIATAHDLGHSPFGHQGEKVLCKLSEKYLNEKFWHEKNGLRLVDKIELLEDFGGIRKSLDLTYAVRDGIISHCGEVDKNTLSPRDISIGIDKMTSAGEYEAATWEGCVVKLADKIAYVGRDIEDAITLGILGDEEQHLLYEMAKSHNTTVNTTSVMYEMIVDICNNSSPQKGICMSDECGEKLRVIKEFNYKYIYNHKRLKPYCKYVELVINEIFNALYAIDYTDIWKSIDENRRFTPKLCNSFEKFICLYCQNDFVPVTLQKYCMNCENEKIYSRFETKTLFMTAIIDFIAGMTDRFAVELFEELLDY